MTLGTSRAQMSRIIWAADSLPPPTMLNADNNPEIECHFCGTPLFNWLAISGSEVR